MSILSTAVKEMWTKLQMTIVFDEQQSFVLVCFSRKTKIDGMVCLAFAAFAATSFSPSLRDDHFHYMMLII